MPSNERILPPQTAYRRRLSEMLDLTYELEGLLHIGVTRSAVPPRLNQLIVDKLNALVTLADAPARPEELEVPDSGIESDVSPLAPSAEDNSGIEGSKCPVFVQEDTEKHDEMSENPGEEELVETEDDPTSGAVSTAVAEEKEDVAENEEDIEDDIEIENGIESEDVIEEDEDKVEVAPEIKEEIDSESQVKDSIPELDAIIGGSGYYEPGAYVDPGAYVEVDESFPTMERTRPRPRPESGSVNPLRNRGRLFSINDRFLFAREIFGGSLKNFDKCMNELITLDSYDEAEEYMMDEWNLDPERSEGIRFLSIISKLYQ